MQKDSPSKIYGLLGYPARHSFSPAMHNAAFKALGINADYRIFEVKPEELDYFLAHLDENNILGLNVTLPYKERVLDFVTLDPGSAHLRAIKAVNTITNQGGVRKGFNTDIPGFTRHLKENMEAKNKKAAILGAGGAARAACYALAASLAAGISVFDIDKEKSENIVRTIKSLFPEFKISSAEGIEELDIKGKDLLVNATPVGLKEADPCIIKENMLHKGLFVYDLIYNPRRTKLIALAEKAGCRTANGLGMLLYQGMLAFEIWTGRSAPREVMEKALLEAI